MGRRCGSVITRHRIAIVPREISPGVSAKNVRPSSMSSFAHAGRGSAAVCAPRLGGLHCSGHRGRCSPRAACSNVSSLPEVPPLSCAYGNVARSIFHRSRSKSDDMVGRVDQHGDTIVPERGERFCSFAHDGLVLRRIEQGVVVACGNECAYSSERHQGTKRDGCIFVSGNAAH